MIWMAVIIFVAVALFLVLPVRISLRAAGDTDAGFRVSARVMPFAGLVGAGGEYSRGRIIISAYAGMWRLYSFDAGSFKKRGLKRKKKKPEKEAGTPTPGKTPEPLSERIGRWTMKARGYRHYAGAGVRALRALIRIDGWSARVRFGLGDPGLTGQLAGFVYALNGAMPERFAIVPEWDFTRRTCAGEASIAITFRTYILWVVFFREVRAYLSHRGEWTVRPVNATSPQEA